MSTMILSPTRVQRTLEVATAALLTLAVMACKSQSTSVNGAPSAQPLLALTLPGEIDLPNGAVLQGDDIWVAGYPKLFVGSKSKPAVAVDVKLDDKAVGVWSVRPGKAGELALVVGELHGKSRIVRFDTDKRTATVVTTAKDPRQIAWVGPANSWWYTATDTSLNTLPDGIAAGQVQHAGALSRRSTSSRPRNRQPRHFAVQRHRSTYLDGLQEGLPRATRRLRQQGPTALGAHEGHSKRRLHALESHRGGGRFGRRACRAQRRAHRRRGAT